MSVKFYKLLKGLNIKKKFLPFYKNIFVKRIFIPKAIRISPPMSLDDEANLLPILDPIKQPKYVVIKVIVKLNIEDKTILRFKSAYDMPTENASMLIEIDSRNIIFKLSELSK